MLMWNTRHGNIGLLNLVLFIGLYNTSVNAIPINAVASSEGIKYPIHVACECIFTLYVDGIYVGEGNKENYDPRYGVTEWNDTKKYYPVIRENEPKIIAFNGMGGQYPVFPNGFIMDMNDGKDYTKYDEWKCKDFSKTVEKTPPSNWFTYDYDDSDWNVSTSYGANYQNNSFQMFETPRYFITLNAEWLWTETNSDPVIYCRKKNPNTHTLLIPTTMPPTTTHPTTTAAPTHVETKVHTHVSPTTHPTTTAAPTHVEKKVHTSVSPTTHPTTTAAPTHVEKKVHTSVSPTTHPKTTVAPTHVETKVHTHVSPTTHSATTVIKNYNIIFSPRIKIIINKIKRSHSRSNIHISSLLQKIKLYHDDLKLYKKLLSIRIHLQEHYKTLIRYALHQYPLNEHPHKIKVPQHFIKTLHKLNHMITDIEHNIKFIKGNHKYILLNILQKLKIIYKKDTHKYLRYFMLHNMKKYDHDTIKVSSQ
jgi:hypothetical protein